MKKILVALAAMAVVFSLAGCGKDEKKDTPTESATSLSDPAAGGTESNEDYGDISSNVKKEIDDYEALCSEYYTLLTENIGADEDRRQEVILDLYDLRYDRETTGMAISDLDMTEDEIRYWIDVKDSWDEKIEQAERDFWAS
ncbi:MAG: hypothetical protein HDQ95_03840 [Roseburia sp.]|nr:hypothetical protein [Roseburia sp.]